MKYRPTPLNIVCGLAFGLAIYSAVEPGPFGWGYLMTIYLIPIIVIGLLADFILQKLLPNYLLTIIIELFILTCIYFAFCWTQRTKTLIIPDNLQSQYVATIYDVENSAKLPDGWNYEIKVPTNGILLTSSTFDSDLTETKIKTYSGINLNSEETKLGWVRITHDKFNCNGKTYEYQLWMIDSSCCMYSSEDLDSFKITLQKQFCGQ